MSHQMHLNKSGSGFTSRTACGRNILRTPMSTDWENFKMEASAYRCIKCEQSKQFEVNARSDLAKWIPEDQDAWKDQDDATVKAYKFR